MKRFLHRVLLTAVILFSAAVLPLCFRAESCRIPQGKPYIDGYEDSCYGQVFIFDGPSGSSLPAYVGDFETVKKYKTRLLACCDDENLYIYAEITGPCENFSSPGGEWFGNSLVLGFEYGSENIVYSIAEFCSRLQISCVSSSGIGGVSLEKIYSPKNLPSSFVKAESNRCIYELALAWESIGVSPRNSSFFSVGAAFVFNEVPYSAETVSAVQLSSGFAEGLKSGDMTGAFTSEFRLADSVPYHIHTAGETVTVENPSCQKQGKQIVRCSACGETVSETVFPRKDHRAGEFVTVKEPTATEWGMKKRYCVMCGCELESEYIDFTGKQEEKTVPDANGHTHNAAAWETVTYPTCISEGYAVKKCTVCQEVLETETLPFSKHAAGPWRTVKFPTEIEEGERARFCTVCGEKTESKAISLLGDFTDFYDGNSFAEKYSEALLQVNLIDESLFSEDSVSEVRAAFCEFSNAIDSGDEAAVYAAEEKYRAAYEKLMNSENGSYGISPRTAEFVSAGDMEEKSADDMIYRAFLITFISFIVIFAAVFIAKKIKNKTEKE